MTMTDAPGRPARARAPIPPDGGLIDVSHRARCVWWHQQVLITPAASAVIAGRLPHVLLAGRLAAHTVIPGGPPVAVEAAGVRVWMTRTHAGMVLSADPRARGARAWWPTRAGQVPS